MRPVGPATGPHHLREHALRQDFPFDKSLFF